MQLTSDNIYLLIAVASSVFAVFLFFRKPQEKGEINDAVTDEKIKNIEKETESKFSTLKDLVVNLRDNHIHTVDCKLDKHISDQTENERKVWEKLGGIDAKLDMLIKK